MYTVLRIIRGIAGFIAGWQIFGLLPVIGWLSNLSATTGGMWAIALVKALILVVFGAIFFGLRSLINNLHTKRHGIPHPALAGRWSL